ncbi:hypothetical protein NQ314_002803 [Rhamnusium bicolor]|uniref:Uncharacterized protein n=1 Tax=Rhamnusium bicolor TaxID=1586634 RepID=A0AAV8ZPF5_9CUCU|nr:hypothetical protein NQ314_002803 [Rhamnusium bicolor]
MYSLKEPELVAKIQSFFGVKTNFQKSNGVCKTPNDNKKEYIISNKFFYYLFIFGTALGDETFYSAFIPFWFWNVDGAVGRRVVLVWTIVMYIGQGVKDIIRWPRPGPPVVRLQNKWALEYGMPSTHAMEAHKAKHQLKVNVCKKLLRKIRHIKEEDIRKRGKTVSQDYKIYPRLSEGTEFVQAYHLVANPKENIIAMYDKFDLNSTKTESFFNLTQNEDVIVGLALAVLIMFPLVPTVDHLDDYFLTSPTAPFLLLVSSILMIVYYPNSGKWTPTRGDTTMILSVCVGIHIGAWLNYQTGLMTPTELSAPYIIMWPSYTMLGCLVLRTIIGFACVLLTKQICTSATYQFLCALLREDVDNLKKSENTLQNKHKTIVELGCKYVYCAMIGFNTLYLLPQLFRFLRIERPTFFTEI